MQFLILLGGIVLEMNIGVIIAYIMNSIARVTPINLVGYFLVLAAAYSLILYGCYLWTKIKNRHWLFMLWGILSPIGLLGISLLKDKTETEVEA